MASVTFHVEVATPLKLTSLIISHLAPRVVATELREAIKERPASIQWPAFVCFIYLKHLFSTLNRRIFIYLKYSAERAANSSSVMILQLPLKAAPISMQILFVLRLPVKLAVLLNVMDSFAHNSPSTMPQISALEHITLPLIVALSPKTNLPLVTISPGSTPHSINDK